MGNGNTFRGYWQWRFMTPVQLPPNESATNIIQQGMTLDYFEDFSTFLGANTIASYTIDSDPLLTINSSSNATPRINYNITAPSDLAGYGPWQQVQIVITDSANRTLIRTINFEVITPPVIQ
jgi:hypothetical protein